MSAPTVAPATFDGSVTEPGVYEMTAEQYHADPVPGGSLSASGAKKLLPPSCPAIYQWERKHPPEPKAHFDLGHAAHAQALGSGPEVVVVEADDWRTKKAQQTRIDAREAGQVALLQKDFEVVCDMADVLRAHPAAAALFGGRGGQPEQSLFWVDERTGIWRRARLDWFPVASETRLIVPDYKTTKSAAPEDIQKAILDYCYFMQAPWYLDAVKSLGLAGTVEPVFVFVFQSKTPPYPVTVVQMTDLTLEIGRRKNREAIDIYKQCTTTGRWPGYSDRVELLGLPGWAENRFMQEMFP